MPESIQQNSKPEIYRMDYIYVNSPLPPLLVLALSYFQNSNVTNLCGRIAVLLCLLFPVIVTAQPPFIQTENDSLPEVFPPIQIIHSDSPAPGNMYFADFSYTDKKYGAYL